jgi:N-hydroxyarylamine O-acetyltransferase
VNLRSYVRRIGYEGELEPTVHVLRGIHLAHARSIPFENLDIHLGRPILLDLPSVERKLVDERRGGYCFEQNHLLMGALSAIGFDVTPLAAWVGIGDEARAGLRTHMLLRVEADGRSWVADAGFGADGLVGPIPLAQDEPAEQDGRLYRLTGDRDALWTLERDAATDGTGWEGLYSFTLEPATAADYAEGNRSTSTDPRSPFVRTITAQLSSGVARPVLRNRRLKEALPDGERSVATLAGQEAVLATLEKLFGLTMPAGTRFAVLG